MPRIVFAPKFPKALHDVLMEMKPAGFDLVAAEPSGPEFFSAVKGADYFMGFARNPLGPDFYAAAPNMKLVQLISAGYNTVDLEAARRARVPVANPEHDLRDAAQHDEAHGRAREHLPRPRGGRTRAAQGAHHQAHRGGRARRDGGRAAVEGQPAAQRRHLHDHAAHGGADVGQLAEDVPQRLRQHPARARGTAAALGGARAARLIEVRGPETAPLIVQAKGATPP